MRYIEIIAHPPEVYKEETMDFLAEAKKKLTDGAKSVTGNKEKAMSAAVKDALLHFCEADAEFAQAVAQGGEFKDCMSAVAKGVGGSISDLEAYRRAVQFYFPGADVRFEMRIDLCASVKKDASGEDSEASGADRHTKAAAMARNDTKIISLEDFL